MIYSWFGSSFSIHSACGLSYRTGPLKLVQIKKWPYGTVAWLSLGNIVCIYFINHEFYSIKKILKKCLNWEVLGQKGWMLPSQKVPNPQQCLFLSRKCGHNFLLFMNERWTVPEHLDSSGYWVQLWSLNFCPPVKCSKTISMWIIIYNYVKVKLMKINNSTFSERRKSLELIMYTYTTHWVRRKKKHEGFNNYHKFISMTHQIPAPSGN